VTSAWRKHCARYYRSCLHLQVPVAVEVERPTQGLQQGTRTASAYNDALTSELNGEVDLAELRSPSAASKHQRRDHHKDFQRIVNLLEEILHYGTPLKFFMDYELVYAKQH
jgi:hypothetical protein